MEGEDNSQQRTVPVIEEELVTGTRRVKTGSVRVRKEVQRTRRTVEIPSVRDVVEVSRKAVNQVVATAPSVREEGDTLIIPVIEEEIVLTKRLVLKEEVHVRRFQTQSSVSQEVTLGRESAVVERLDGHGQVIATTPPSTAEPAPVTRPAPLSEPTPLLGKPKKGLLE